MAKLNTPSRRAARRTGGLLATEAMPSGLTHEGTDGYGRDSRSELFLAAITALAGEGTFYEKGVARDDRLTALIHSVAHADPVWAGGFLPWLRADAGFRTASVLLGVEYGRARATARCAGDPGCGLTPLFRHPDGVELCEFHRAHIGDLHGVWTRIPRPRRVLDAVCQRADEPGEALAYFTSLYGKSLPTWLRRGIGDAAIRLWTPYAATKYDSPRDEWRMADIMELCHPGDRHAGDQELHAFQAGDRGLFKWLLDDRHGGPDARRPDPQTLPMLAARAELARVPVAQRRAALADPERFATAGVTWEWLAGWLQGPMDDTAWSVIAPTLPHMALLRNLANLDKAGVPDHIAEELARRLADPDAVRKGRQFPWAYLLAYLEAPSDRWKWALSRALDASLGNIPDPGGRTLILIDLSASMNNLLSDKSKATRVQAAALFGIAYARALAGRADVVGFGTNSAAITVAPGGSVLRATEDLVGAIGIVGHTTHTSTAVARWFDRSRHDRVVIFTDDQPQDGDPGRALPLEVPLYIWDLGGYQRGATRAVGGTRHLIGGFSTESFRLIPLLEQGASGATWPWAARALPV